MAHAERKIRIAPAATRLAELRAASSGELSRLRRWPGPRELALGLVFLGLAIIVPKWMEENPKAGMKMFH